MEATIPVNGNALQLKLEAFQNIANNLRTKAYCVLPNALPSALCDDLLEEVLNLDRNSFSEAGVGRKRDFTLNPFVRNDEICWISGASTAGKQWLQWTDELKDYLNRELFLGLFSFESHFAHYPPGAFYKKHKDSFKGQSNRVLSVVLYLNKEWELDAGGELLLYPPESDTFTSGLIDEGLKVTPCFATLVVFLSEEFPHEVLATRRDRYSIAGWYRVNTSCAERVDPPR